MFNRILDYVVLSLLAIIAVGSFYNFYLKSELKRSKSENQNFEVQNRTKDVEINMTSIASKAIGKIHEIDTQAVHIKSTKTGIYTDTF